MPLNGVEAADTASLQQVVGRIFIIYSLTLEGKLAWISIALHFERIWSVLSGSALDSQTESSLSGRMSVAGISVACTSKGPSTLIWLFERKVFQCLVRLSFSFVQPWFS